MSEKFDPYYKWLGIPPKDQPPNHYRLLGLELFESDADVIATVTDQRMAHVKSFASGAYSNQSQEILNELATAKLCLLNPAKKAEYDRVLAGAGKPEHAPMAPPQSIRPPSGWQSAPSPAPDFGFTLPSAKPAKKPSKASYLSAAIAVACLILASVLVFVFGLGKGDRQVADADSLKAKENRAAAPTTAPRIEPKIASKAGPIADSRAEPKAQPVAGPKAAPGVEPEVKNRAKPDAKPKEAAVPSLQPVGKGNSRSSPTPESGKPARKAGLSEIGANPKANARPESKESRAPSGETTSSKGSRDSDIHEARPMECEDPCSGTETRYHSEMVSSPRGEFRSISVPHAVVVHFAEMGQIRAKFVDYKGAKVALCYESGQLPAKKSVDYRRGVEYQFAYTAFSDPDKAILKWIKDTAKKKNSGGLFELNALSRIGTEGVLTGEVKPVKVLDERTALMHQLYQTDSGTISWDFTLRIPTKFMPETFSGLYKITKKDFVERSGEQGSGKQ